MHAPRVAAFYDQRTGSIQYVASDPERRNCTIIDPVIDFEEKSESHCAGKAAVTAILDLPPSTKLVAGHDYRPNGRPAAWESTIADQKTANIHLTRHPSKDDFVRFRDHRDATLPMPRLILHTLQVNIAGQVTRSRVWQAALSEDPHRWISQRRLGIDLMNPVPIDFPVSPCHSISTSTY